MQKTHPLYRYGTADVSKMIRMNRLLQFYCIAAATS